MFLFGQTCAPKNMMVAFLGADGAGKSTVIEMVAKQLAINFDDVRTYHLRPGLLRKRLSSHVTVEPHAAEPRGRIASIAKLAKYFFVYHLGYVIRATGPRRSKTLVIVDRYYHDLLVDPRRYRYGGPMWLARFVGRLVPKPELWIVLDAPAEVLQSRKQEVTFEETYRQRETYVDLGRQFPNTVIIDAAKPLDDVVAATSEAILDYMAQRTAKRLRG